MSVEIQTIVELLRGPPFGRSEGLVDFSKKSAIELLQVVNDVFAAIDDRQKKDIRDEGKDEMTARMLGFITVLGYKIDDPYAQTERAHSSDARRSVDSIAAAAARRSSSSHAGHSRLAWTALLRNSVLHPNRCCCPCGLDAARRHRCHWHGHRRIRLTRRPLLCRSFAV